MITITEALGRNTQPWMAQAACKSRDPDLFYAHPMDHDRQREAKRVCNNCPVIAECLTQAIENDEPFGVWGGYTARERHDIRRTSRPPTRAPQCGTYAGAKRHYNRGEQTCQHCRQAAADHSAERRGGRKREPKPVNPPTPTGKCGTESGAKTHAARGEQTCDACRQASTTARRRRLGLTA